jgi:hypothetical protein
MCNPFQSLCIPLHIIDHAASPVLVLIEASAKEDAAYEDAAMSVLRVVPYPIPPIASNAMDREVSHEYFFWTINEIEEYGVFIEVGRVALVQFFFPSAPTWFGCILLARRHARLSR